MNVATRPIGVTLHCYSFSSYSENCVVAFNITEFNLNSVGSSCVKYNVS